ncbi:hypothetical protein BLL52_1779 [Rhodoferax antarcticus ANT.BR]|uniref:Uncharacterized protein n=1 Tax=Rhodoferax antarcticus ANT.BR TaxID=1111071 RepID=A0A1Q8YG64_9BURK|nr:hypothetical protein BLL52_1779 [Rhodoferax antarcticus ANT.BR]
MVLAWQCKGPTRGSDRTSAPKGVCAAAKADYERKRKGAEVA